MARGDSRSAVRERAGRLSVLADHESLDIGKRIKALREARGWSARALAEACTREGQRGLSRSAIAKIEVGQRRVQADEALALARVFGIPLGGLLGEEPEPGVPAPGPERVAWVSPAGLPAPPAYAVHREAELDRLVRGLNSRNGPHTWLVIGPPGIGKTTLIAQLVGEVAQRDPRWAASWTDARDLEPDVRLDGDLLLNRMLATVEGGAAAAPDHHDAGGGGESEDREEQHRSIAQRIIRDQMRVLCVLDSAEELPASTSTRLRSALGAIHGFLRKTGKPDAWLAFVVGSRRDDGWRSIVPQPRLTALPVRGLTADAIEERLHDMEVPARAVYSPGESFASLSSLIEEMTAGVPELLDPFLGWMRDQEWLDVHRVERPEVFKTLASPYVRERLLARDGLFPVPDEVRPEQAAVVEKAVRFLVRYRFFTQFHLRHYLDEDEAFREDLEAAGWEAEDLWEALSGLSILSRPLDEPWQEIHPAIRRLLFRYFYPSSAQRVTAHQEARQLTSEWAHGQSGKDQVVGLTESFWHATLSSWLARRGDVRKNVLAEMRDLREGIQKSETYGAADLRLYAVDRMADDSELQRVIASIDDRDDGPPGNAPLADELARLVLEVP